MRVLSRPLFYIHRGERSFARAEVIGLAAASRYDEGMIELAAHAFAQAPSLSDVPIFTGFARAVIEHATPGRVWLADGGAHALHSYGMSLVWGEDVGRAFPALLDHLRGGAYRSKDEWLQIDPRWDHLDWEKMGAERFARINFRFDRALFEARHSAPVLPPGWTLQPLDADAFAMPDVLVSPHHFWKDVADLNAHGGGVAVVRDGEVGAIAFSATRFDDWLEIGIETRAPFRGQGLARAVAVAMVHKCFADGLTPVWACRKQNVGSFTLAQSLGFVVTKELPFWRLSGPA